MNTLNFIVSKFLKAQQLLEKSGFTVNNDGSIDPPKDRNKFHQNLMLSLYVGKAIDSINGQYYLASPVPQYASLQVA